VLERVVLSQRASGVTAAPDARVVEMVARSGGGSERFAVVVLLLIGLGTDAPENIVSPRLRPPAQVSDLLC
jgi:hypothetical protein